MATATSKMTQASPADPPDSAIRSGRGWSRDRTVEANDPYRCAWCGKPMPIVRVPMMSVPYPSRSPFAPKSQSFLIHQQPAIGADRSEPEEFRRRSR